MVSIAPEFSSFAGGLAASRAKLLKAVEGSRQITFIYGGGNIGDHLIWAGAYRLLEGVAHERRSVLKLDEVEGDTAIITGGGGWCRYFRKWWPERLADIESRFHRVIVFPSSYEIGYEPVRRALTASNALFFAREKQSYKQIKDLCRADYAYDSAFFFDFAPYRQAGSGTLYAYRVDHESRGTKRPAGNNDISAACKSLETWLHTIASHDTVYTDRAHVTIAAAMLGKKVFYRSSNYHKVPGIVRFSLRGFPVYPH